MNQGKTGCSRDSPAAVSVNISDIKNVKAVYYSATGNTARVVRRIAEAIAAQLAVPVTILDITLPDARESVQQITAEELVIAGTPVYAGKIPNKFLPYWKEKITGSGTPVVPVVTFGNRGFDHALAELCHVLTDNGFCPIAAGAFVMPHVFSPQLAADRPDRADEIQMERLAQSVVKQVLSGKSPVPVSVPGEADAPYYTPSGMDGKPAVFLKARPKTAAHCDHCGICAAVCPMGSVAVPADAPARTTGVCIKCQACIIKCPEHARYFDDAAFLSHVSMLEQTCNRRTESVIFTGRR